jgi:hypothetical protein
VRRRVTCPICQERGSVCTHTPPRDQNGKSIDTRKPAPEPKKK